MAVTVTRLRFGSDNCYLLEQNGNTILVDTGRVSARARLSEILKLHRIELAVLTHGHFDHISNAAFLQREHGIKIAMHRADISLAADNRIRSIASRGLLGILIKKRSLASIRKTRIDFFRPDILLQDGQELNDFGVDAQVIELAGHTAGSIGILTEKACIVGDLLMNVGFACSARIAEDFTETRRSIERLKCTTSDIFYPGHGGPILRQRLMKLKV